MSCGDEVLGFPQCEPRSECRSPTLIQLVVGLASQRTILTSVFLLPVKQVSTAFLCSSVITAATLSPSSPVTQFPNLTLS